MSAVQHRRYPRGSETRLRRGTGLACAVLIVALPACGDGSGPDLRGDCFRATKTADPDDDARIHLFNFGAAGNAGDVEAVFEGPSGQRQVCSPVSTDIAAPTNVVFFVSVGDEVSVTLSRAANFLGSQTCTVAPSIFDPPDPNIPNATAGFADFGFSIVPSGSQFVAEISCGTGFEFQF